MNKISKMILNPHDIELNDSVPIDRIQSLEFDVKYRDEVGVWSPQSMEELICFIKEGPRFFTDPMPELLLNCHHAQEIYLLLMAGYNASPEGRIVEIGSDKGGGIVPLTIGSKLSEKAKTTVTIDYDWGQWGAPYQGAERLTNLLKTVMQAQLKDDIHSILGSSVSVRSIFKEPISLLFVDGDHSHESCYNDITTYEDLLIPGAHILCHDYNTEYYPGVSEAVDELLTEERGYTDFIAHGGTVKAKNGDHLKTTLFSAKKI